jgi:hypothetical protein
VGQENSWPWMVRTGLGAVILHRLWGLWVTKPLLYVTSHFIMSVQDVIPYQQPNHHFQPLVSSSLPNHVWEAAVSFFFFFLPSFLFCGTGVWTQGLYLEPLH